MNATSVCTSILEFLSPVVGTVFALHAEVDVGPDAAVVQQLDRTNIVTHAQEDLRGLVLAQQPQGVHLGRDGEHGPRGKHQPEQIPAMSVVSSQLKKLLGRMKRCHQAKHSVKSTSPNNELQFSHITAADKWIVILPVEGKIFPLEFRRCYFTLSSEAPSWNLLLPQSHSVREPPSTNTEDPAAPESGRGEEDAGAH